MPQQSSEQYYMTYTLGRYRRLYSRFVEHQAQGTLSMADTRSTPQIDKDEEVLKKLGQSGSFVVILLSLNQAHDVPSEQT